MYNRILVPVDGSPTAERGLQEAIGLALGQNAKLLLLYVVDDFPMLVEMASATSFQETLKNIRTYGEGLLAKAKGVATQAGVAADTLLRDVTHERIADAIVDEAMKNNCDLIVMGTHGRRGFSRLTLGSDAELVLRHTPVPVLLVRQEETTAPAKG